MTPRPLALPVRVLLLALAGVGCSPSNRTVSRPDEEPSAPQLPRQIEENAFGASQEAFFSSYADMPIPWQPWTPEALQAARESGRPVVLHVGYSTCPFSRQFRHACLDHPELSSFLAEHFVCLLADAETDAAINHLALECLPNLGAVPAWPILLWMTPTLHPYRAHDFTSETGFDPESVLRTARRSWQLWNDSPGLVDREGEYLLKEIQGRTAVRPVEAEPDQRIPEEAYHTIMRSYDEGYGTVAPMQNFPRPTTIELLLALADYFPDDGFRSGRCREAALNCLRKMAQGAILDPLDGCFHRYSEKPNWNAPHSEKLASDQTLIAMAYLAGAQADGGAEDLRTIAFRILDELDATWMREDGLLGHARTAFDTARPSHTAPPFLAPWYTWSASEIDDALQGPGRDLAALVHGIRQRGNMPPAIYSPKFGNRSNVLATFMPVPEAAERLGLTEEAALALLDQAHASLRQVRAQREGYYLDDRALATENALLISALTQASLHPGGERFAPRARALANAFTVRFLDDSNILRGSVLLEDGTPRALITHADLALSIQALLDSAEHLGSREAVKRALALQAQADAAHYDADVGAYRAYSPTAWIGSGPPWIVFGDAALPSDNAVAARNLGRLAVLDEGGGHGERRSTLLRLAGSDSTQITTAHALLREATLHLMKAQQ